MAKIINETGIKEYAMKNPKKEYFNRNNYTEPNKAIEILLRKNKNNHIYTSIYNYNNSDMATSVDVTDADVIFDRLVFDFDVDETDEHILINNGYKKIDLEDLSTEQIKIEASKIKEKEQQELSKCKTDEDIQNFYIKKYENNYLKDAYDDCLKVVDFFVHNFAVEPIIFFSGSKGTHLYILLNNPIKIKNVDKLVYKIGDTFKNKLGIKTIDENVYSSARNRLIRLPCSQHQTTKLYNTQILMSTKYDDMIVNSAIKQDIDKVLIPQNDTTELENWLMEYDATITNELENKDIAKEINNNDEYILTTDIDIFNNADFKKNFLKVYKKHFMNSVGYSFTHLCFRNGFAKEDVVNFFKKLEIEQNFKKVHSWINRTYGLDINVNRVGGLNNFLKEVSSAATETEHDALIKYFKSIFKRKEKITVEQLPPFQISTYPTEYKVNGIVSDGKYREIQIKDIMVKGFDFILDLRKNKAFFKYSDIEYDFNYKYNKNGFVITNKTDFKDLLKLIKDMLNVDLKKSFEFSLKTYLSRLYEDIYENNQDDKETYIINLVRKNPTNTKLLIDFAEFIERDLNIKKTTDGECFFIQDNPKKYSNPTTDILTTRQLGYLLLTRYNLRLVEDNITTILKSIHGDTLVNTSRWELANNYYLETLPTYQVVKYENPIICSKKLGLEIDGKFKFFEYEPNVKLLNKWDDATLTERTLRQILIPKTDKSKTNLYKDFLQRLGASFFENNIHKAITIYYSKLGNNGKSILSLLHEIIFKTNYIGFEPKDLKQDIFATGRLNNKHSIWADELTKGSFDGVWDTVKRFSSGLSNVNPRIMYEQSTDTKAQFGMLYLNSNVLPKIPINDRASLERTDILIPPNRFDVFPTDNEYKLDVFLAEKLKNDFDGLQWLVNASIKAYLGMPNNTFICKQNWKKTLSIIKETDDILNFLIECTKIDFTKQTSNSELYSNFLNYCDENDIINDESTKTLTKRIGSALNEVYGDDLVRTEKDRKVHYNIRILSKAEIEAMNDKKIIVDEMEFPSDYKFKEPIHKTIYDFIKNNNANTINELKKEFPKQPIKEILKHLKNEDLIHFEDII